MDSQTLSTKSLHELATRQHSGADAITIAEGVGEIERRMGALTKAARLVLSIDPFVEGHEELQAAIALCGGGKEKAK